MGVVPKLDMEDSYVLVTAIRIAQLVFTGVVTGLTAAILKDTWSYSNPSVPSSVTSAQNFLMFCAVVNWLSSLYGLVGRYIQSLAIPLVQLPLDAAGTVFSLIGGIVIAVKLRVVDCHKAVRGSNPYGLPDDWMAAWPDIPFDADQGKVISLQESKCRMFQADDVFMFLLFATAALSLFFTFRTWKSGNSGSYGSGGGFGMKNRGGTGGIV